MRQNSNSVDNQKIKPNEHYGVVGHVTDSFDHGCGQACYSMCSEDVVLYLGCYCVHLGNHFEIEIEKPSQKCGVISFRIKMPFSAEKRAVGKVTPTRWVVGIENTTKT